ncbi:hypothetical protein BCR36DRAFT_375213 [Piromyces finnis]|uniref:Uncharacterized protein n=1 Tax=Piromyces finnis TaxID=1754191 RepID=A0A1Y1UU91_9FUNG|nr:hypothetical protein BCR36DRAFT_375213 [Piromyces finnis]|eukprot:ORX41594.1 hypothetical protein BCR36DRAFT_375213 [Piromyces finnis]
MENLEKYYNTIIDEITNKAVEVFNNSYNLDIKKESIIENLENEISNQPPIKEMNKLSINDTCIAIKRNKTTCKNKCTPGHVYCGTHLRSEGKLPLPEHIKMVANKYKYEIIANTVLLGNEWISQNKLPLDYNINTKWPLKIESTSNSVNSYILFFTEFSGYFGAGVFVIHYISSDKKESYYMATHYVEVNKYGEDLQSNMYAKVSLKSIDSLKDKPIYKKIISFLGEYGIPYDINDINKRISDITENNPVVMYNNIINVINSHYNIMYFSYDSYINSNINVE